MNENLIPLEQFTSTGGYDLSGAFDPTGANVYGANGERMGRVHTAMVEPNSGRLRYLLVDTGGFFSNKRVLVPVGLARIESDDDVYIDSLTKDQLKGLQEYREGMDYSWDSMASDEKLLTGREVARSTDGRYDYHDQADATFRAPQRLQLLEERLKVDKHREKAGEVEVTKRVETRRETVPVELRHEEVEVTRRVVTDGRPIENPAFGADGESIRMDLEAERAEARKETFVAEEVDVTKREVRETQNFSEELRREDVDVRKSGAVNLVNESHGGQADERVEGHQGGRQDDDLNPSEKL